MTITLPCNMGQITGLTVPWQQFPTLNPAGDRLAFVDGSGSDPREIYVYRVPELTLEETITAPTFASGYPGAACGLCYGADGTLYYGQLALLADVAATPDYQYDSRIDAWDGSSWTLLWSDSYAGGVEPDDVFQELGPNGIYYDVAADDVYFTTVQRATQSGVQRIKTARIRGLLTASVLKTITQPSVGTDADLQAEGMGPGGYWPHPTDGSIWTVRNTATTRRLRRYGPGFTSPTDIDFQMMLTAGSAASAKPLPAPDNPDHVFAEGRFAGTGANFLRLLDDTGTSVDSYAFPGAFIAYGTWTPDLSRVMSFLYSTGSPATILDWTGRCAPDVVAELRLGMLAMRPT